MNFSRISSLRASVGCEAIQQESGRTRNDSLKTHKETLYEPQSHRRRH
jgi:hypothetical protein